MERVPLYQVDAFTDTPFRGNPAAVCLLPAPVSDACLQAVAAEMNLSETAFLLRTNRRRWRSGNTFSLRWFTPQTEVPLCGHATLGSAAVFFDVINVYAQQLTFQTASGDLTAEKRETGIALNFPADPAARCALPADVVAALGLAADAVVDAVYGTKTRKLMLHVQDARLVRDLRPDFAALLAAKSMADYRGLIVTAAGEDGGPYDFVSRFFAPWIGINEDPVTGSAHTVLTPYWAERLGKDRLHAYQASARGGELWVRPVEGERVELLGQARVVLEGYLTLPES